MKQFWVLIFVLHVAYVNTQVIFPGETEQAAQNFGRCLTPNRERGLCVILNQCGDLYRMLQKTPLYDEDKLFLRKSQCGYHNGKVLVCCRNEFIEAASPQPPPPAPTQPSAGSSLLPMPGVCGNMIASKIYGGNLTQIDEYPWMTLLEYTKTGNRKGFHCGGSLINNRYILTASHCVNGLGIPTDWRLTGVRLGEWNISTEVDCQTDVAGNTDCAEPHQDIAIEKIIPHPNYDPASTDQQNDIALLRLAQPVRFTDFIKPICLPRDQNLRKSSFAGIKMDVAGWGKTEKVSVSNVKLKATVTAVNLEQCNSVYSQQNVHLDDSQMCAGGEEGIDSCRGDSGGPLIGLDRTSKVRIFYFIAGVVSFGPTPCGLQGWPGVYTKVGSFIDWIERTVEP